MDHERGRIEQMPQLSPAEVSQAGLHRRPAEANSGSEHRPRLAALPSSVGDGRPIALEIVPPSLTRRRGTLG